MSPRVSPIVFHFQLHRTVYSQTNLSLATDTEYVRERLAAYANDLLSLGIDGFRLDASKRTSHPHPHPHPTRLFIHFFSFLLLNLILMLDIASGDIANILSRLSSSPYVTQEVIWGAGEAVQPSEYIDNGTV